MQSNRLTCATRYFILAVGIFVLFQKSGVIAKAGERNLEVSRQNQGHGSTDIETQNTEARLQAIERHAARGGPQAVAPLIKALEDNDFQIRKLAALALGEIGDMRAIEPLINALADFSFYVRSAVVEALGKRPDTHSVMPLFIAMGDKHTEVGEQAARSLENLKIYGAVNFYNSLRWSDEAIKEFVKTKDGRLIEYIISAYPHWDADTREM